MNESSKLAVIVLAILVLICAGWYALFYRPQLVQVQTLKQKTDDLVLKINSFTITDEQLLTLEAQVAEKRSLVQQRKTKLVTKEELPKVVDQIRREGNKYGLRFQQIIPDFNALVQAPGPETEAGGIRKLVLHLSMRGRYLSFGKFLEALMAMPFQVSLGEFRVAYEDGTFPELQLGVDTEVYLETAPQSVSAHQASVQ